MLFVIQYYKTVNKTVIKDESFYPVKSGIGQHICVNFAIIITDNTYIYLFVVFIKFQVKMSLFQLILLLHNPVVILGKNGVAFVLASVVCILSTDFTNVKITKYFLFDTTITTTTGHFTSQK